jgi:hypothetical protein
VGEEVEHMAAVDNFLAHYGVKGMRWGSRSAGKLPKEGLSKDAQTALDLRARAKRSKPKALSNKELQEAINRMNLEQQFKRLSVNEKPAVQRWMASTLLEIGKREVQVSLGKKVAATVAKKAATGGAV